MYLHHLVAVYAIVLIVAGVAIQVEHQNTYLSVIIIFAGFLMGIVGMFLWQCWDN